MPNRITEENTGITLVLSRHGVRLNGNCKTGRLAWRLSVKQEVAELLNRKPVRSQGGGVDLGCMADTAIRVSNPQIVHALYGSVVFVLCALVKRPGLRYIFSQAQQKSFAFFAGRQRLTFPIRCIRLV
jgi:hypothetical protein